MISENPKGARTGPHVLIRQPFTHHAIMISTTLRYFLQVADTGSVTSAAEILHVAPSAISRRIQSLEQIHHTSLFERNARGMRLTEAGEILATYVRRATLESERASAEILSLSGLGGKSTIRVAANEGFGREFVPHVIGEFRKRSPDTNFELQVLQRSDVRKTVQQGEVDLGMAYSLAPSEGVDVVYSQRAPLCAILSPDHPLAKKKILTLHEIAGYDVVMSTTDSSTRMLVDYCCMHARIELNYIFTSDYSGALQHYVRDYNAITLAGAITVRYAIRRGEVVAIPLTNSDLYDRAMQIYAMSGRQLPKSVERFLALMIEMADQ